MASNIKNNPIFIDGQRYNVPTSGFLARDGVIGKLREETMRFVIEHGREPDHAELDALWKDHRSAAQTIRIPKNARADILSTARATLDVNPQIIRRDKEGNPIHDSDEGPLDPYTWDPSRVMQEGAKEHDLYSFYRDLGSAQHDVAQGAMARGERDMQIEMAMQRQQLMDEVRKRRMNQLRSGLSSAQIANEEIQTLLMGQQAQQQSAQQFFDTRGQMQMQHQLNPFTARQSAYDMLQQFNQTATASYAAGVSDPVAMAQRKAQTSPTTQHYYKQITDPER